MRIECYVYHPGRGLKKARHRAGLGWWDDRLLLGAAEPIRMPDLVAGINHETDLLYQSTDANEKIIGVIRVADRDIGQLINRCQLDGYFVYKLFDLSLYTFCGSASSVFLTAVLRFLTLMVTTSCVVAM